MESSFIPSNKVKAAANWLRDQPLSWLMAGQVVAAVTGLAYGKLTALYIAPGELGVYNLFYAGLMFLYALLISPVNQSFKASLSRQPLSLVARSHGGLLLYLYAAALLLVTLLAYAKGWNSPVYVIWLAAVGQGVYALSSDYLNVKGRYSLLARMQITYALVNLLLFLLCCCVIGWRTAGALWTVLAVVNLLLAALSSRQLGQELASNWRTQAINNYRTNWTDVRAIWQYALPLTTMAFWSWLINYAGRYLLHYYRGDSEVGTYTMGYSLGSKLLLLATPMVTYLTGVAIRQKANGESFEDFQIRQTKYIILYVGIASLICLVFYAGRHWFGLLFMSRQYEQAFLIGPLIAISYLFITTISLFEIKWYVYGSTQNILTHNIFGAIGNVSLNGFLIPKYGLFGSAYAMIGSTFCQLCLVIYLYNFVRKN